jgi:hypothetical protein
MNRQTFSEPKQDRFGYMSWRRKGHETCNTDTGKKQTGKDVSQSLKWGCVVRDFEMSSTRASSLGIQLCAR